MRLKEKLKMVLIGILIVLFVISIIYWSILSLVFVVPVFLILKLMGKIEDNDDNNNDGNNNDSNNSGNNIEVDIE